MASKALIQYSAKLAMESNETFKCCVCFERLSRPIKFCKVGHLFCENCQQKLTDCAICHQDFSDDVNVTLEQILENSTFPCKNEMFGCKVIAKFADINKHENLNCDYKKIGCGLNVDISNNPCNEVYKLCDYKEHVRQDHLCREKTLFGKELRRDIIIDFGHHLFKRTEVIEVFKEEDNCENSTFFLEKIAYSNQNSIIIISYHHLGLVKHAEKYQYNLLIKDDKNPTLCMTHQNNTLPIGLSDDNIRNSGKSLLMSLKTFMNVNERRKILNLTLRLDYTEKEKKIILNSKHFLNAINNSCKKLSRSKLEEKEADENVIQAVKDQDATNEINAELNKKEPLKIEELGLDAKKEMIELNEKPVIAAKENKNVTNETSVMDVIRKWLSILLAVFAFLVQIWIYMYFLK